MVAVAACVDVVVTGPVVVVAAPVVVTGSTTNVVVASLFAQKTG